ncbi:MAG: glycosyltransferase family 2 protein [Patescibacteria group bacterium]|nr:glycosyltransferase family 2 protein [Patescibacteria group bacterium]MDD3778211.1 glycosyltransferase family 2 protein [Patescibacteria group bacterium]MDD3939423.1 glycosyltransferase family 2 protein [Patescibacteria group bacterium]MDD4443872.1 glycosyltransferase family 2 protein [Patescibacteria group bacterium]NCU39628.1 glycosyltransferase family 2 protein [Candidatus Falkowbacteria bacterium]
MKIFCIIPAYNEEKNIASVITRVKPFVDRIVVVNDCSVDKTAEIVRDCDATLISHPINRGQGAALQTGNEYALTQGADIIIHFDADNQFQAEEIPEVIAPLLANQADAVLGSRFLSKQSNLPAFKKNIIMPLARTVNRLFFNIKLSDPQSGFRALNRKAAQKIKIQQDGMAHCSEIMHQLFAHKLRVSEIPITVIYHEFGQKFSGGVRIVKDIIIKKIIK